MLYSRHLAAWALSLAVTMISADADIIGMPRNTNELPKQSEFVPQGLELTDVGPWGSDTVYYLQSAELNALDNALGANRKIEPVPYKASSTEPYLGLDTAARDVPISDSYQVEYILNHVLFAQHADFSPGQSVLDGEYAQLSGRDPESLFGPPIDYGVAPTTPPDITWVRSVDVGNTWGIIVPEPSSLAMVAFGALSLAWRRRHAGRCT
jgi:hypothetical protein